MKRLSVLLGALLLSAAPVVADDLVYLECEAKSVTTTKDLKSNQITKREETADTNVFKVDLANNRHASAKKPEWEDIEIIDGVAVLDEELTEDGLNIIMKASWQIVPPGRITADGSSSNDATSETFKVRGMCKASEASVFEKALNQ